MTDPTITERLEYLRGEIEAERISYSELAELQSLAETDLAAFEGDVVLLEWAGVPEFPPTCDLCNEPQDADGDDWNGETGQHYSCESEAAAKGGARMSTYPTSAELAAFRCTFDADEAMPGIVAADYMAGPRYPTTRIGGKSVAVTPGGAWPHEREHGIGYRITDGMPRDVLFAVPSFARRETNKLRREAYTAALMTGTVDPVELDRAIRAFAPRRETPGDYYQRHRLDGVSD